MNLSPEQIAAFDRDGYLFFPGLFTPQETAALNAEVPELYSRREAFNVREKAAMRCAPILQLTCTASRLPSWHATRA